MKPKKYTSIILNVVISFSKCANIIIEKINDLEQLVENRVEVLMWKNCKDM